MVSPLFNNEFHYTGKSTIAKLMFYSPITFSFATQRPAPQDHPINVYQKNEYMNE